MPLPPGADADASLAPLARGSLAPFAVTALFLAGRASRMAVSTQQAFSWVNQSARCNNLSRNSAVRRERSRARGCRGAGQVVCHQAVVFSRAEPRLGAVDLQFSWMAESINDDSTETCACDRYHRAANYSNLHDVLKYALAHLRKML